MSKKAKLPKRIAGIKIPKKIRRDYKPLLRVLGRPEVQALVGAALTAGAAALADQSQGSALGKLAGKWTGKKAKRRLKFFAAEGNDRATEMAEQVGRAVASAIGPYLPGRVLNAKQSEVTH